MITLDARQTRWQDIYARLVEIVQPRPIALVSTINQMGQANLAPFSFFTIISCNPPYLGFFVLNCQDEQGKKDTLRNLEQVGQFVVASVTESIAAQVNQCSALLPYGDSEFEFSGLTPAPAHLVRPSLVQEAPINLECELVEIRSYGDEGGAGNLIVGKVLLLHIDPSVLDEQGRILSAHLQAVGRMGGEEWCRTRDVFSFPRPDR